MTTASAAPRAVCLPAVLVTGRGDLAGDDDIVLTKPFDGEALHAAMGRAVHRAQRPARS